MKKVIILSVALTTFLIGCDIKKYLEEKEKANAPKESPEAVALKNATKKITGSYTGSFGTSKISLLVTQVNHDTISGRAVVNGIDKPFDGILKINKDIITVTAKESGKNTPLGKHEFILNEKMPDSLSGIWTPDTVNKKVVPVKYTLMRKKFEYKKDAGIYTFSSTKAISDDGLNGLSSWEINVMKNEIYARHGMIFTDKSLRDAFETKDWYVPVSTDVSADLTEMEKSNLETISDHK